MYDEDYEEKRKLKNGECYEGEFRLVRNPRLHKKAFSLLNTAWALLPEKTQNGFRSIDAFRSTITVAAGFVEVYFDLKEQKYCERPKSWAFDSMDEAEFEDLYERMKDVIWSILSRKKVLTYEKFEQYLSNY